MLLLQFECMFSADCHKAELLFHLKEYNQYILYKRFLAVFRTTLTFLLPYKILMIFDRLCLDNMINT